jgi:hypothetical protein
MKKKILALLILIGLVLMVAGCTALDQNGNPVTTPLPITIIGGGGGGGMANPMSSLGDIIVGGTNGSPLALTGDTSDTDTFLRSLSIAGVAQAPSWQSVTKSDVGLSNVENTALSSWVGTSNIATVGTIGTGTWQGGIIGSTYGGTGVNNGAYTLTLAQSGTLGTAAYTSSGAYSPIAGSSSIVTVGTLTSGATGAGFTVALGTSTISGGLPTANGGVPTGGTANQVLSKIDGTNYNTQWSSALSVTSVTATTYSNIIGSSNSSFGQNALQNNTTGLYNNAFGQVALYSNTTGLYNNAFGQNALQNNTTGQQNNAFGQAALYSNTTGQQNSAFGQGALQNNTTGQQNSAFGVNSLQNNTTGVYNSAFGVAALYSNTTGNYNSAFGAYALYSNTTGQQNSAFGVVALQNNTTGNNNLGLGYYAGLYNTTISNQLFINTFDQGSYANDVSNSLIYGIFNATPASQTLAINAGKVQLSYLPSYANNAAALSGGLVAGDLYRLSGGSLVDPEPIYIVH